MSKKTVTQSQLNAWVDAVIADTTTYGVQAKNDKFDFAALKSAADLRLDYDVTLRSPKYLFLPARERLATFTRDTAEYHSEMDTTPFVVLGVHPYDVVAIRQMDTLFSQDNRDEHYMARRESATIVAVDVQTPSRDVFAGYMGNAAVTGGFDVLITRIGEDAYLLDAATDKGEKLLSLLLEAPDATDDDVQTRARIQEENVQKLRKHELRTPPAQWPALLKKNYEHPVWEEKSQKCFSCGSCNLVCPTCYCFDVHEDVNWDMASGERERTWDGCMLQDFATVAGGHNFRKNKTDRYRHRYYRKGDYVPSKIGGEIACVGCGRCIGACVAKIANPVEIFNRLAEEK